MLCPGHGCVFPVFCFPQNLRQASFEAEPSPEVCCREGSCTLWLACMKCWLCVNLGTAWNFPSLSVSFPNSSEKLLRSPDGTIRISPVGWSKLPRAAPQEHWRRLDFDSEPTLLALPGPRLMQPRQWVEMLEEQSESVLGAWVSGQVRECSAT